MKRLLSCALLLMLLVSMSLSASATNGNVSYSGDAGKFIFQPGSTYSPTDLFPNFKDVMPGDTLRQSITLNNDASNKVKIKVYMRSLGAHADSVAFLSQLKLRVEKLNDTVLFDAAADQTAQLTDWVCLGTLYSGGKVDLDVLLDVPVTLDNDFKKLVGYLDWEFMIEEYPIEETDPVAPTGDETPIGLFMGLTAGSAVILGILILLLAKRKKKEDC